MAKQRDLSLDDETIRLLSDELENATLTHELRLQPDQELRIAPQDERKSAIIRKLERYVDFEGGGLRLLEVPLRGQPVKFLLAPELTREGVGIRLKVQYRF